DDDDAPHPWAVGLRVVADLGGVVVVHRPAPSVACRQPNFPRQAATGGGTDDRRIVRPHVHARAAALQRGDRTDPALTGRDSDRRAGSAVARCRDSPMSSSARPSWDEYFMIITRQVAERSTCLRAKVGAVIVRDRN